MDQPGRSSMTTLSVDGKSVRVFQFGSGKPVVYLHSIFGEVGEIPFFEALASRGYRVIAPIIPGFPGSDHLDNFLKLEDMIYFLGRVIEVLDLGRVPLVGSSLGGWMACELGTWFPDRYEKLVLINSFGLRVEGARVYDIFRGSQHQMWDLALANGDGLDSLLEPALKFVDSDSLKLHLFSAMEATAAIGWNPYMHDPRLADRLGRCGLDTLIVWGTLDGIIPLAHAEQFSSLIDGSRVVEISTCGHVPVLEDSEFLANVVGDFL